MVDDNTTYQQTKFRLLTVWSSIVQSCFKKRKIIGILFAVLQLTAWVFDYSYNNTFMPVSSVADFEFRLPFFQQTDSHTIHQSQTLNAKKMHA